MSGPGSSPEVGLPAASVTIVGAADSSVKSRIPTTATRVYVSANTNDTNDWIVLPPGTPGKTITGYSVVAHEMRTEASSGILINNVDSDGTQEAAIPSTTLWTVDYVNDTTGWILRAWTELAAPITAIVPD